MVAEKDWWCVTVVFIKHNPVNLERYGIHEVEWCSCGDSGQAVARTSNAVVLRHTPSGLVVKCHQTRSLERNRTLARQTLVDKLDRLINGDDCVAEQQRRLDERRDRAAHSKARKLDELKRTWRDREGIS